MTATTVPDPGPPELRAEAAAYEEERQNIVNELERINVSKIHNRERGRRLIQWMQEVGINIVLAGKVYLTPYPDGRGFARIPIDRRPNREPR